jgi:FkbM family methyltransferase
VQIPKIEDSIKRLRIDIGLSYDAPNSQEWLDEADDVFVFGFEPAPENCKNVSESITSNRFHLYEYAVSNTNDIKTFNVTKHSNSIAKDRGQSSFYEPSSASPFSVDFKIQVKCVTLNYFLSLIDWSRFHSIELMKIDAQGHDLEIIKSANKYMERLPLIKLESSTNGQYSGSPRDHNPESILKFMKSQGYSLVKSFNGDQTYAR